MRFKVSHLKGHDNSPNGFKKVCYIQLKTWMWRNLRPTNREKFFLAIAEGENYYEFLYQHKGIWYKDFVNKSQVLKAIYNIEEFERTHVAS